MAKDYINDYNSTASNNTDAGGVSIAEGTAPSNINDAIREVMSHLAGWKNEFEVGADIASSAALAVNIPGMFHNVTGTTTITSLAATTNDTSKVKVLQFDGVLTLTHHATDLILPRGANITTAAGDIGIFYEYASGDWRCVSYFRANTGALSADELVATATISSDSAIDFENTELFDGTFSEIYFKFTDIVPASDNSTFQALLKFGGAYATANYRVHASSLLDSNTSYVASVATNAAAFNIGLGLGTGTGEALSGKLTIFNPASITAYKLVVWDNHFYNSVPQYERANAGGTNTTSTGILQGARFQMGSSVVTASGVIEAWGRK